MNTMSVIFSQLAALLLMAAAGWLLVRTGRVTDEAPFGALLTNISLPAMILANLQSPLAPELLSDMALTMAGLAVIFAVGGTVAFAGSRLAGKSGKTAGAWMASVMLPNAIYMAQPLMVALYGESILYLVAPVLLMFNLSAFVLGKWLLSGGKARGGILKGLIARPVVMACLLGLALYFMPFRLPGALTSCMSVLGSMGTPLSMVIIGCQLARCVPKDILTDKSAYAICFLKLIPAPVFCFFVLRTFVHNPSVLGILTICASMPTAAIVSVIAMESGGETALCSKTTFLSTLLCVFTAPVILYTLLR